MDYKDYYKTLGVSKNSSQDDIRNAFRKLARQYHPDANEGNKQAEEKFKDINEAYQVLSDPEKRKKYDQFGAQWQQYSRGGGRPEDFDWGQWAGGGGGGGSYTRVNIDDLQDLFGGGGGGSGLGGFSDFFETLFGQGLRGRGSTQRRAQFGQDLEQNVEITLEEAYTGTTRVFQREDGNRFEVKIPRGVKTGSKVRVTGKGQEGRSGQAGNLYLKIKVLSHSKFKRDKDNLKITLPIDLYTAVLGGEAEVPTLERTVNLKIPAGTSNGKTIRLRGLGMPNLKNPKQFGDIFATIEIKIPENLSQKEKELFKQLRELRK